MRNRAWIGALLAAAVFGSVPAGAATVSVDPVSITYSVIGGPGPGLPPVPGPGYPGAVDEGSTPSSLPVSADVVVDEYGFSGSGGVTITDYPAIAASALLSYPCPEDAPDCGASGIGNSAVISASGSMTFYFELVPTPGYTGSLNVPVLLDGTSTITTEATTGATATSSVSMCVIGPGAPPCLNPDGEFEEALTITPDTEYEVTMSAGVTIIVPLGASPAGAQASIDPLLSISPTCNCSGDYEFVFSDLVNNGFGQLPGTPEPSTWAMMLIGCAGLGFAGWRARHATAATARLGA